MYVYYVSADLFAYDTTFYDIQASMELIEKNHKLSLNQLHIWCKNNGMVINSENNLSNVDHYLSERQRLPNTALKLKYNDESLKIKSNDKILGVFVDNNLIWSDHVKHICKKIFTYIWLLSKSNISYHSNTVFNFINLIPNLT